jgi:hypothetical protein
VFLVPSRIGKACWLRASIHLIIYDALPPFSRPLFETSRPHH